MKIMIVVSPGGHLLKMWRLKSWWKKFDRVWVSDVNKAGLILKGERIEPGFFPENRNVKNFLRNFLLAVKMIWQEKPQVMVSTGAGVALPFFIVGKIMRVRLVFIETFIFIAKPTLTGKILYLLADEFIVQNRNLQKYYKRAHIAEIDL